MWGLWGDLQISLWLLRKNYFFFKLAMIAYDRLVLRVSNGDSWNLQIDNETTTVIILSFVNFGLTSGLLTCRFHPFSTEFF